MRILFTLGMLTVLATLAPGASPLDELDFQLYPPPKGVEGTPKELLGVLGKPRPPNPDPHKWYTVAFSPDGKRLACTCLGQPVQLYQFRGKNLGQDPLDPHKGGGVAFSPDGNTMAFCQRGITLWDLTAEERKPRLTIPVKTSIFAVAFAPDGNTLAAACHDNCVRLWDLRGKEATERAVLRVGDGDYRVRCVAISPDGKTLAFGSRDKNVRVYDLTERTPRERAVLKGHSSDVHAVAFSPDGKFLVSGCPYEPIPRLWNVAAGKEEQDRFEKPRSTYVMSLAFSPDGRLLARTNYKGDVVIWNFASGKKLHEWNLPGAGAVAISPDGRYLATSNSDGTAYIVRLAGSGTK